MGATAPSIGFAGLGAMGFGMATNLLKAGFSITAFDLNCQVLEKFDALGGTTSSSLAEASRGQAIFFVMVATPDQVDSLVFGRDGLAVSLPNSAVLCLFSTLPPEYVVGVKTRLEAAGRADIRLLDCPVSGGVVGADSGQLSIMIGGDDAVFAKIRPALESISAPGKLFATGPLGSASTIKMLNQHLAGSHLVVAAEALAFAKSMHLSTREARRVLLGSEGYSWMIGDRGTTMLNADWRPPKSAVAIFTKDLGIVNNAADSLSVSCPVASTALQAFSERAARGYSRDDDASVVCNYEGITGLKVAEREDESAMMSPRDSPTGERCPVVLVTPSKALEQQLQKALLAPEERGAVPKLWTLRDNGPSLFSELERLPADTCVGVSGTTRQEAQFHLQELVSKFPKLQFFDYEVVLSRTHENTQILFSANNRNNIAAVLSGSLGPDFEPAPVHGPIGSAAKMYLVIKLASLIHVAAAAECYSLAGARGVSTQLVYDLIAGAAGSSAQFNQMFPRMLQKDLACDSSDQSWNLAKAMEDLKILSGVALNTGFPSRLLDATYQIFKRVSRNMGDSNASTAALISYWGT